MNSFFSIIIPALNEEYSLPKLLDDLYKQEEKNFEVIVVNAKSSDKTLEEASRFKGKIALKVFTVERKNVSYSRNFGASESKAPFLIFLDADTGVDQNFTKQVFATVSSQKALVFVPSMMPEKSTFFTNLLFWSTILLLKISFFLGKPFSSGGNIIIEKKFFNKIHGFDETAFVAEDHELIKTAHKAGATIKFLSNVKIKTSLRRLDKEGPIIFWKYFISTMLFLVRGKITTPIYEYKMGGHHFDNLKRKSQPFDLAQDKSSKLF